jgi:hypothetical protein
MAIRVSKIAASSDGADTAKILPSDLNPTTLPSVPQQDDIWFDFSGTSPSRTLAIKVYDGSTWRTIASATY